MTKNRRHVNYRCILSIIFALCRFIFNISSAQITIFNLILKHEIMELTIKKPTNVKKVKKTNGKTIQFFSAKGVKKVFDIHRYSENGTLYFKRKTEVAVV